MLEDEVVRLEEEIKKLKTQQITGVDSFNYYFFSSGNVYNELRTKGWNYKKKITFTPVNSSLGDYICRFFCISPGQWSIGIDPYPYNYNMAHISVGGEMGEDTFPDLDFAYFGCITTVDGIITIEDSDEGI